MDEPQIFQIGCGTAPEQAVEIAPGVRVELLEVSATVAEDGEILPWAARIAVWQD